VMVQVRDKLATHQPLDNLRHNIVFTKTLLSLNASIGDRIDEFDGLSCLIMNTMGCIN